LLPYDRLVGVADLHLHTNLGDGWISPRRLVAEAVRKSCR